MPIDKDLKRLVRARMAATHENYTAALAAVAPQPRALDLRPLIAQLADPATLENAYQELRRTDPELLIPALVGALRSGSWRIRRSCCRILDDLDFTPESLEALEGALDDPDPRVRRSAVHTLSCQDCKPNGCALDVRPLFERMVHDTSPSHAGRQSLRACRRCRAPTASGAPTGQDGPASLGLGRPGRAAPRGGLVVQGDRARLPGLAA